ncbi:MAG: SLC13/DASS family transporter [Gammaproteobacteria bacterium]|nr:SLC13/DASS family transporter [Gammaproteobacteria bacterium]
MEQQAPGSPSPNTSDRTRVIGLVLGVVAFTALTVFPVDPGNDPASRLAAIAALMAIWWMTEAIPLFATALLPLVLFPLLGIMSGKETAPSYINSVIVLFIGGFMIALTMQRWNLHRRIALNIIRLVGGGPARIVLGFMVAAAFLSMWISNTATAVTMVPMGLAVVLQVEERLGADNPSAHRFSVGLMLGIAYGCSVGGMTTLVGTPPNLSLVRIFEIMFPEGPSIAFGQWMIVALPVGAIMVVIAWLVITRVLYRAPPEVKVEAAVVERELERLGPITFEERAILAVFAATALLWVFRVDLNLGTFTLPGWSRLLPWPGFVDDGTVAITMASLLFFIPGRGPDGEPTRLMGTEVIPRLPWNVVLLIGGGFALAVAFQQTGLAEFIGGQFAAAGELPVFVLILLVCLALTFLTELTSNTATTEMILPILASVAVVTGTHPLMLMIPATMSASCAFMMPVATPPNAIVFGSNRLTIAEMARAGIILNLIGAVVIASIVYTLGLVVFGIEPGVLPGWAESLASGEH